MRLLKRSAPELLSPGRAGSGGVEGVDTEDGFRLFFQNGFEDREDARLFFIGCDRRGVGPGRFAADVKDVGTFFEKLERLDQCPFGSVRGDVEMSTIGEGIRRDVEHAEDESTVAQVESPVAELPFESFTDH